MNENRILLLVDADNVPLFSIDDTLLFFSDANIKPDQCCAHIAGNRPSSVDDWKKNLLTIGVPKDFLNKVVVDSAPEAADAALIMVMAKTLVEKKPLKSVVFSGDHSIISCAGLVSEVLFVVHNGNTVSKKISFPKWDRQRRLGTTKTSKTGKRKKQQNQKEIAKTPTLDERLQLRRSQIAKNLLGLKDQTDLGRLHRTLFLLGYGMGKKSKKNAAKRLRNSLINQLENFGAIEKNGQEVALFPKIIAEWGGLDQNATITEPTPQTL